MKCVYRWQQNNETHAEKFRHMTCDSYIRQQKAELTFYRFCEMWWKTSQNQKEILEECIQWKCGILKSVKRLAFTIRMKSILDAFYVSISENHNFETPTMCEHWLCFVFLPRRFVRFLYVSCRFISWYRSISDCIIIYIKFIHTRIEFHTPESSRKPIEWVHLLCLFASCFCLRCFLRCLCLCLPLFSATTCDIAWSWVFALNWAFMCFSIN